MDLSNLKIFGMATRHMSWLTKRQEVLAQNIANADTPAYRPKDLKSQDFSKFLRPRMPQAALNTTNASHIESLPRSPRFRQAKDRETYEVAPAGNAVILEEQLMKVTETQSRYRLATNLYQKHLSMLRSAIGRDRG